MATNLTAEQCRVIGVMLEKEVTTPEQYPLSLNALTNGCNQKSNREPVLTLSESDVQNIVDQLMAQNLVTDQGAFSGRVAKYSHRFCNTEFGSFKFTSQQRAVICVLFLRGPQTPGELRTRTNRLTEFSDVEEVEGCLTSLHNFDENQLVVKLAREPGKRESRYAQCFSDVDPVEAAVDHLSQNAFSDTGSESELAQRVATLEQQVEKLQFKFDELLN